MTISIINAVDFGSTGKIMRQLQNVAESQHFVVDVFSKRKTFQQRERCYFGFVIENLIHRILSPLFGCESLLSLFGTISLCRQLLRNKTELIHLHNIHGYFFCFPIFFRFVKKHNIPIIWTLHDCWAFTGRCPYFDLTNCQHWKTRCHNCPYPCKNYPSSYIDTSSIIWFLKKKYFTNVKNMTIVTPSKWLSDLVKQSFLKDYPVKVINNGIDLSIFKPTQSDFRDHYGLVGKKIVLGVAYGWNYRKGLDVFIELQNRLPKNYQIVLVGTNKNIDGILPTNIISIHRTQSQKELAEIYSTADVFVNPTREEVFGLVNVEAIACGTPVVTFKTGGSPECIDDTCGSVVPCNDIDAMEMEIRRICEERPYSKEACIAHSKNFDMNARFQEYVDLYKEYSK